MSPVYTLPLVLNSLLPHHPPVCVCVCVLPNLPRGPSSLWHLVKCAIQTLMTRVAKSKKKQDGKKKIKLTFFLIFIFGVSSVALLPWSLVAFVL